MVGHSVQSGWYEKQKSDTYVYITMTGEVRRVSTAKIKLLSQLLPEVRIPLTRPLVQTNHYDAHFQYA